MPQEELPTLSDSDMTLPALFGVHLTGVFLCPPASSWMSLHPLAPVLLTYGSCDQWAGTCAVKELKFSSLSILLQCSSPSFAELILHTWSVPDRYLRQDSDQLTHFKVANWLWVLFPELSWSAPGEKPLSMKEGEAQRVGAWRLVLLLLGTSEEEVRNFLQAFLNQKCVNSWGWGRTCPLPTNTYIHNRFFHPYLLRATEFLVEPSAESLRYKFNEYKNLPPWQQSKKAQMSRRWEEIRKLGMCQDWRPQRKSHRRYLSTFSLQQLAPAESEPSLSWNPHNNKSKRINACSRVVPRSPPTKIRRLRELCTWQDEVFRVLEGRSHSMAGGEWQPSEPLAHAVKGGKAAVWVALANFYNGTIIHQPSGRRSLYFFCIQLCVGRC